MATYVPDGQELNEMLIMTFDTPQEAMTQVSMSVPDTVARFMNGPGREADIVHIADELVAQVSPSPEEATEETPSACSRKEAMRSDQSSATATCSIGEVRKSEIRAEATRVIRDIRAQIRTSMRIPVNQAKKAELEAAAAITVAGIRARIKLAQAGKAEPELPHHPETEITVP